MTKEQLEQFKKWFHGYVAGFYGRDELTDDNIRLKEDHTRRMCADTRLLSAQLGLNEKQEILAETISLFHDIGRFEQFMKYRSYNDVGTENHSLLGLKVLAEERILDCLDKEEKNIIETAIMLHGDRDLPNNLDSRTELFAKLIRDVDKLDIYYVATSRLDDIKENPERYFSTFGLEITDEYSKHVIEAVFANRTIGYDELKTLNDLIIAMFGWIMDVNFVPTLVEMKKRKLLERMSDFLPDTEDIRAVIWHVKNQLDKRISSG